MRKSRPKSRNTKGLIPGKGRGPAPGTGGRPPSLIREQLRGSFTERIAFLNSVADGVPIVRQRVLVMDVAPHLCCPTCGELSGLQLKDLKAAVQEIEVVGSASVKDRLQAVDMTAKYGLGTSDEKIVRKETRVLTESERSAEVATILKLA